MDRVDSMDVLNKDHVPVMEANVQLRPVDVDGMNKDLTPVTATSVHSRPVGMDGMNKATTGGVVDNCAVNFNENLTSNEIKVTNVYEEDLSGEVEVTKDAGYTTDCKDVFEPTEAKEMSYIGETARPLRERVVEHMSNLKNGSMKSFIISHWMDVHGTSVVAPEFKWQVLDKYSDALRRQLAEGLHIMNSGVLNKKVEFSTNIICRMQATTTATTSEAELQKELDERRVYKDKLRNFVSVMSKISPDFDHMRSKNMKKKNSNCTRV